MTETHPIVCAWCRANLGRTTVPHSYGICPLCRTSFHGLPRLTEAQLDDLPYGVIQLDVRGFIRSYNRAEGVLSGRKPAQVVGKNFFLEVAPCTAVRNFQGRFLDFLSSGTEPELFEFNFAFPKRNIQVSIALVRAGHDQALVLVKAMDGLPSEI